MDEFVEKLPQNKPILFVVGGVSKGNPAMEVDYTTDDICVSKYPLSAACCISKIMNSFENLWGIH